MMITRYPAFSSLIFICILIFSISITISTTSAQDYEDQRYLDCSTEIECGALRFGFPFSGSNRPSYCGLPEFNLTCNNRIPTISIADLTYRILEVDNNSRILTLLQDDYARSLCPAAPRNATEVPNLFEFSADTQLLTLYYGCESLTGGFPRPPTLGSFTCPSQLDDYFVPTDSALEAYESPIRMWLGGCRNRVRVPVNQTAVGSLEREPTAAKLTETINDGFGMRWPAGNDTLCATCRVSGGQCGFNDTTRSFTCFCFDQPYGEECPTAGPTAQLAILSIAVANHSHYRFSQLPKLRNTTNSSPFLRSIANADTLHPPVSFSRLNTSRRCPVFVVTIRRRERDSSFLGVAIVPDASVT
ncbi:LEAF RUST 10 DISEASE-RESISTANCE LOCUS RECEPTOR-LIKE PROTEIN KINASE-like 2.7 [Linum perenne]